MGKPPQHIHTFTAPLQQLAAVPAGCAVHPGWMAAVKEPLQLAKSTDLPTRALCWLPGGGGSLVSLTGLTLL